jgi:hypothetical protein
MLMIIRLLLSPVQLLLITIEGCTTADAPAALTTVAALETAGLTITDACTADLNLVVSSSATSTGTCPLVITRTYVLLMPAVTRLLLLKPSM